jgi:hypothetical protein
VPTGLSALGQNIPRDFRRGAALETKMPELGEFGRREKPQRAKLIANVFLYRRL